MTHSTTHVPRGRAAPGPVAADGRPDRAAAPPVCHIVSTFPPAIGGVQNATLDVCERLRDRGVDVVVLTRRHAPDIPRYERISGVPVYRLGWPLLNRLGALSFAISALALLATRLRRYRVLHVQNIDVPLLVGVIAKRMPGGRRLVATIHGESKIEAKRSTAAGRARLAMMRRSVDRYTALTPAVEATLREIGVDGRRIERIPNGIDTASFRPPGPDERRRARRWLGLTDDRIVAVSVGRLVPLKRIDLLLEAWVELDESDVVLLVVGDGPERERLERAAAGGGGPEVRFLGWCSDVRDCFRAADLFVLPSASEGLPMSLLEAMAMGLPAVATSLPGIVGLVRHGEEALLVPPNDPRALGAALDELIRTPRTRAKLGRAARAAMRRKCDLGCVAESHLALYRSLPGVGSHDV